MEASEVVGLLETVFRVQAVGFHLKLSCNRADSSVNPVSSGQT
jgi:hypothetical protein